VVRARAYGQERATALVLAGSQVSGKEVCLPVNRNYLLRALALGFTEMVVVAADVPVQWGDDRRRYVWMPLDKEGALAGKEDDLEIVSAAAQANGKQPQAPKEPARDKAPIAARANGKGQPRKCRQQGQGLDGALAEAQQLRGVLRDALARTQQLLATLKQQRQQGRLLRATLASLKQLQRVSG